MWYSNAVVGGRMHFFYRLTWFSALVLFLPFLVGSHSDSEKLEFPVHKKYEFVRQTISPIIQKEMKKNNVVGLSIALIDDQRVVWSQGFGYADRAGKIPATPETIYRVGSISKLFTAAAVMQLVENHTVDLDKPLQTYLPEFSVRTRFANAGPITIRMLLTHHSGLPSNLFRGMWTKDPEPFSAVVKRMKDEYAAFPPGFVFSYSNIGATLAGSVIERIAGRDFASHVQDTLFRPLGMDHSGFSSSRDADPSSAHGYLRDQQIEEPGLRDVPAGGLNSSVSDLSRFIQMIFNEGRVGDRIILKPDTIHEMMHPQNTGVSLDLNFRVGLGWMLSGLGTMNIQNAGPVAHHGGSMLYYQSQLIVLPKHKLGVVVLSNSSGARTVVDKAAIATLTLALEAKAGIKQPEQEKSAFSDTMPDSELQSYEGWYASMVGAIKIVKKSNYLRTEIMNRTVRLMPRQDGQLGLQYKLFGFIPIRLGELEQFGISRASVGGREILKAQSAKQEMLIAERIQSIPITDAWLKRMGDYEISNGGEDTVLINEIRLRSTDGLLLVEYAAPLFFSGTMSFALKPISDAEAVVCGLTSGAGETIRAVTVDGNERLYYSGYLLEKKSRE